MFRAHLTRLLVVAAAIQFATGLSLFAFPGDFSPELYGPLLPLFPRFATLLIAGGLMLLIMLRFSLNKWVQRLLALLAMAPILLMAILLAQAGGYTGAAAYLILVSGVVGATWAPIRSIRGVGDEPLDQFALVLGLIHLAIGLIMLLTPSTLHSSAFDPIRPVLPLVGLFAVGGAILLLLPVIGYPLPLWGRRLGGLLLPMLLTYTFFNTKAWTGVILWVLWGAGSLLDSHPILSHLPTQETKASTDPDESWSAHVERQVESWSWVLTLMVVAIASGLGPLAADLLPQAVRFALIIGGYNILVLWLLPSFATSRIRLNLHLVVIAAAVSLLIEASTTLSATLLPVLLALPLLSARSGGRRWGFGMLSLILIMLLTGSLFDLYTAQAPLPQVLAHLAIELLTLGVTGAVGVTAAAQQRRLFHKLERTTHSLSLSYADLQAAHEELQAQSEELMAKQDELLRQHQSFVEQSVILSAQRDELQESESRFRTAFMSAPIGIALISLDMSIIRANPALHQMLGYPVDQLSGKHIQEITHPDDYAIHSPELHAVMANRSEGYSFEKRYLHRDGHVVWVAISTAVVRDTQRTPLYMVSQIMDVTERRRAEEQLRYLADYDSLTNLINRRRFQAVIEAELNEGTHPMGCLLFLDFDQFKFVNDTLGHPVGDKILKSLARVLRSTVGQRGTVARLGGDEFGVLVPKVDSVQAELMAAELLGAVRNHIELVNGQPVGLTVSIGVALYPTHGTTVEDLMLYADLAMYQAKSAGRDRHRVYLASDLEEEMGARLNWDRRIREALAEDRFHLHFQPILDLHTNEVVRYEALLRMSDRDGNLVGPKQFLRIAESYGLIHALDRWVVSRAIQTIGDERKQGRPLSLSVNLSAKAFSDPELLTLIHTEIVNHQVPPDALHFEITETAAVVELETATVFIKNLTNLGCHFSLDDFGAGFSSLVYLKRLPVTSLKIDGGFIERLPEEPVDQQMVKAVVTIAKELGMRTVAEYVGSDQTLALLRELGVDAAQGFHIGRPGPLPLTL